MARPQTGSSLVELKQLQALNEVLNNENIGEFSLEHF
jgi:hypothetical protein